MIKLIDVWKEYPRKGVALRDVSFHVKKGEFAFLTGHSGSGKTTALRLIHMADRPTRGEVRVSGFSTRRTTPGEVWKLRRRVGHVFQDFRLLPGRTAQQNLSFALEVTGASKRAISGRCQRLLTQVGLAHKSEALVHELSGGEQQRVAIARALANDPLILLADEPTGNLDERASRGIVQLFRDLNALGMAVLMATHDLELVRRYPESRVLELNQGELVYDSASVRPPSDAGSASVAKSTAEPNETRVS